MNRSIFQKPCDCGSEERPIPVTAHVHSTEEIKGSDATCTTDGSITYYVCTGCGRYFSDPEGNTEINIEDTVITAYGHNFGEWATAVPATCTASGTEERVCSSCGEKETRNIGATGHNYKESVTAPTCTAQGYTTYECSRCDDSYVGEAYSESNYFEGWVSDLWGNVKLCGGYTSYDGSGESACTVARRIEVDW